MKCSYVKSNNQTCQAYATKGSEYCFVHDPKNKEKHQRAVVRGGQAKKSLQTPQLEPVQVKGPDDVIKLLEDAVNGIRTGTMQPKTASTLGYLSGQLLKAFEVSNLDDRIEVIESIILQRKTKHS